MACFLVPAAEAIAATAIKKSLKAKEENKSTQNTAPSARLPFSKKLGWLTNMLWGGSALLAFEHIWHGEVVPWFPFLTAASDPVSAGEMLYEMATAGVTMAVLVTLAWAGMVAVSDIVLKKADNSLSTSRKENLQ